MTIQGIFRSIIIASISLSATTLLLWTVYHAARPPLRPPVPPTVQVVLRQALHTAPAEPLAAAARTAAQQSKPPPEPAQSAPPSPVEKARLPETAPRDKPAPRKASRTEIHKKPRKTTAAVVPSAKAEYARKVDSAAVEKITAPETSKSFSAAQETPLRLSKHAAAPKVPAPKALEQDAELLYRVEPAYPRRAWRNGVSGRVMVELHVNENGEVTQAAVVQAEPTGFFEQSVLTAVRQWRFKAAQRDGRKVSAVLRQLVEFRGN